MRDLQTVRRKLMNLTSESISTNGTASTGPRTRCDILQKVFYRSNPAREAFVEMCADEYVQKMTFDSYLYKTVVPGNPLDDAKLLANTVASLMRSNALRIASKSGIAA